MARGSGTRLPDRSRRAAPAFAATLCLRLPLLAAAGGRTKYVVHYMPWFLGEGSGHWCNANWGNSYYSSALGSYDVRESFTYKRQLALMKAAGIDGLWFDFQLASWIPRIQAIADEALRIGLNFAVVADNYMDENVTNSLREAIVGWMAMPNYYHVNGRPMLPIFEAPSRWKSRPTILPRWDVNGVRPFVVGTYHWHQREDTPLPDGYDSLFFWISSDVTWAANYHTSTRFSVKVGSIYRGWREAYKTWYHTPPYLGMLNSTLQVIEDAQPDFAQIVTWNDYTEGTMLEPSFVKRPGGCLDPSDTYWIKNATCNKRRRTFGPCTPALWAPCAGSGESSCWDIQDCSKPYGTVDGPGVAGCPTSPNPSGGALSAYYDLAMIANAKLGTPIDEAIATFRSIVEVDPPTTTITTTTTASPRPTTTDPTPKYFEDEADGVGYACRGNSASDSSSAYYALLFGLSRLIDCQARCLQEPDCTGVEHSAAQGRCEVWTVPINVRVARSGFSCLLRRPPTSTTTATRTTSTTTEPTTTARTTAEPTTTARTTAEPTTTARTTAEPTTTARTTAGPTTTALTTAEPTTTATTSSTVDPSTTTRTTTLVDTSTTSSSTATTTLDWTLILTTTAVATTAATSAPAPATATATATRTTATPSTTEPQALPTTTTTTTSSEDVGGEALPTTTTTTATTTTTSSEALPTTTTTTATTTTTSSEEEQPETTTATASPSDGDLAGSTTSLRDDAAGAATTGTTTATRTATGTATRTSTTSATRIPAVTEGATTTGGCCGGGAVEVHFTMQGVDFSSLDHNETVKCQFKDAVRDGVVARVNAGSLGGAQISRGDVAVSLLPGSVRVEAVITPPTSVTAAALDSTVQSASIQVAAAIEDNVRHVPGIESVSTGAIGIAGGLDVTTQAAPGQAAATTTTTTATGGTLASASPSSTTSGSAAPSATSAVGGVTTVGVTSELPSRSMATTTAAEAFRTTTIAIRLPSTSAAGPQGPRPTSRSAPALARDKLVTTQVTTTPAPVDPTSSQASEAPTPSPLPPSSDGTVVNTACRRRLSGASLAFLAAILGDPRLLG